MLRGENNDIELGLTDIEPVLFGHVPGSDDDNSLASGPWNNIILERVVDQEIGNNADQDSVRGKQKVVKSRPVTANDLQVLEKQSTSVPMDFVVSASSSVSSCPIKEGDLFENKKELKAKLHLYALQIILNLKLSSLQQIYG